MLVNSVGGGLSEAPKQKGGGVKNQWRKPGRLVPTTSTAAGTSAAMQRRSSSDGSGLKRLRK